MKASTHLFNQRLYLEGIKRLRVIGIGLLVLVLVSAVLVPTVLWIEEAEDMYNATPTEQIVAKAITRRASFLLCVPILIFPATAPILLLVLFSYLFKRRESDFYHSIPYTRTCVYLSFLSAALTWIAAITLLSAIAAGCVFAVCPYVTFALRDLIGLILISLSASVYLCGFMMLAIALCGNLTTVLLNFLLFSLLPRAVGVMLGIIIDNRLSILDLSRLGVGFLQFDGWLPAQIINYSWTIQNTLPASAATSFGFGVLLLALSGLLYQKRPSQMAGNAAQGPRAQHWLRCLFTLPLALALTTYILSTTRGDFEPVVILVLFIALLLVYYLYELITTKSFRCVLHATPWLATLLVGSLLFTGVFTAVQASVLYPTLPSDEIRSVSFVNKAWHLRASYNSYEQLRLQEAQYDTDEDLLALVARGLYNAQLNDRGKLKNPKDARFVSVAITKMSGRTIHRNILLIEEEGSLFTELHTASKTTQELLYSLPPNDLIEYIYSSDTTVPTYSKKELWSIFCEEYNAASSELKDKVLEIPSYSSDERKGNFVINISGTYKDESFHSQYFITSELPQTHAFLCALSKTKQTYTPQYDYDKEVFE